MAQQSFYVNTAQLVELKQFMLHNMPTARFVVEPYRCFDGKHYYVTISYAECDINKINKLQHEWEKEKKRKIPLKKKTSFFHKIKRFFK